MPNWSASVFQWTLSALSTGRELRSRWRSLTPFALSPTGTVSSTLRSLRTRPFCQSKPSMCKQLTQTVYSVNGPLSGTNSLQTIISIEIFQDSLYNLLTETRFTICRHTSQGEASTTRTPYTYKQIHAHPIYLTSLPISPFFHQRNRRASRSFEDTRTS